MNIRRITSNINHFIKTKKIEKAEKEISEYLKVNVSNKAADAEIYNARGTIANFAKHRGISVDIFDAKRLCDVKDPFSDKMIIIVENLLNGKQTQKQISTDTKAVVNYSNYAGTADTASKLSRNIKRFSHEDGFLRNLYRNIADMTATVTGQIAKKE